MSVRSSAARPRFLKSPVDLQSLLTAGSLLPWIHFFTYDPLHCCSNIESNLPSLIFTPTKKKRKETHAKRWYVLMTSLKVCSVRDGVCVVLCNFSKYERPCSSMALSHCNHLASLAGHLLLRLSPPAIAQPHLSLFSLTTSLFPAKLPPPPNAYN